jgi:hypothetical protein
MAIDIPVTWDASNKKPTAPDVEYDIADGETQVRWYIGDSNVASFEIKDLGHKGEFENLSGNAGNTEWTCTNKATKKVTAHYKIKGTHASGEQVVQDPKISNIDKQK